MCLKRKRKGACQIVEQHLQKARFVWQSPFRLAFIKFHANYWLPKKIKTNLVYFQVFRMQPFFFSAISTHEKKKGNVQEESEEGEEEPEPSPVPSTSSEQWLDGSRTRVNKLLWPSLTYWIALTSPNGAPANPLVVHRTLLECGMGVTAKQVWDVFLAS